MNTRYNIVSIEGNIGSGKSTLLSNLRETLKDRNDIVFLKEPVDEWEKITDENGLTMLEKFYSNQKAYSFPFQMMAYISRLALLKEAVKNNPSSIIITERSLFTDKMVFAKMLYDLRILR
jgi:deoxyadenosine/deoxycytidine kinase